MLDNMTLNYTTICLMCYTYNVQIFLLRNWWRVTLSHNVLVFSKICFTRANNALLFRCYKIHKSKIVSEEKNSKQQPWIKMITTKADKTVIPIVVIHRIMSYPQLEYKNHSKQLIKCNHKRISVVSKFHIFWNSTFPW